MSVSFYDLSIGSYTQALSGLDAVMKKSAEHCASAGTSLDDLVAARLIDDMATFHFQVTSAVHHSLGAIAGLRAGEFRPPSYDECDYAALQEMVGSSLTGLQGEKREEIEALAEGQTTFKMGEMAIPWTNVNFVLSFSLPNFYFHVTTAYDILRIQGAPIGKMDYLGPLKAGV